MRRTRIGSLVHTFVMVARDDESAHHPSYPSHTTHPSSLHSSELTPHSLVHHTEHWRVLPVRQWHVMVDKHDSLNTLAELPEVRRLEREVIQRCGEVSDTEQRTWVAWHGTRGMGHGAWGMRHETWGMGHRS